MLNNEQKIFVEQNHNLIYSFLNSKNYSVDEYYDIAAIGLCKAAESYKEDKSSFATYAYVCMNNEINLYIELINAKSRIKKENLVYYMQNNQDDDDFTFLELFPANANVEDEAIRNVILSNFIKTLSDDDIKKMKAIIKYGMTDAAKKLSCRKQSLWRTRERIKKRYLCFS